VARVFFLAGSVSIELCDPCHEKSSQSKLDSVATQVRFPAMIIFNHPQSVQNFGRNSAENMGSTKMAALNNQTQPLTEKMFFSIKLMMTVLSQEPF
jgi:hypothetical protein